jgi:hypothetical protein
MRERFIGNLQKGPRAGANQARSEKHTWPQKVITERWSLTNGTNSAFTSFQSFPKKTFLQSFPQQSAYYRQSARFAGHLWGFPIRKLQYNTAFPCKQKDRNTIAIITSVDEDPAGGQSCAWMDQNRGKQRSTKGIVRVKRSTYAFVYARPEVKVLPSAMLLPCVVFFNAFFTFLEAVSKKHGHNQLDQLLEKFGMRRSDGDAKST